MQPIIRCIWSIRNLMIRCELQAPGITTRKIRNGFRISKFPATGTCCRWQYAAASWEAGKCGKHFQSAISDTKWTLRGSLSDEARKTLPRNFLCLCQKPGRFNIMYRTRLQGAWGRILNTPRNYRKNNLYFTYEAGPAPVLLDSILNPVKVRWECKVHLKSFVTSSATFNFSVY